MTSLEPLVLIGAGGLARECLDLVRAINAVRPTWDLLGHADDDPRLHGALVGGAPVLGGVEEVCERHPTARVVICCGSPRNYFCKREVARRIGGGRERFATLVHPGAQLGASVLVGRGAVVMAGAVATADVELGDHVVLMPSVVLTHDGRVGEASLLASGAKVAGGAVLEPEVYLGAGCLVGEAVTVGTGSLVGMGSVIRHDVPPMELWAGNPARKLRDVSRPCAG